MEIEQIKKMYPEGCVVRCASETEDIGVVDFSSLKKNFYCDWYFYNEKEVAIFLNDGKKKAEIIAPAASQYPKVMWVWDYDGGTRKKRVVFMEKKGKYLAWNSAETLEEAEHELSVIKWDNAKDIDPAPETIQHEGRTYKLVDDEN